jgi:hypothetical protein
MAELALREPYLKYVCLHLFCIFFGNEVPQAIFLQCVMRLDMRSFMVTNWWSFFALGNQRAQLPTIATAVSALLILSTIAALVILALDYFDYRNRIPIDH